MDQAHVDRLNELRTAKEKGTLDPTAEPELNDLLELELSSLNTAAPAQQPEQAPSQEATEEVVASEVPAQAEPSAPVDEVEAKAETETVDAPTGAGESQAPQE